MMNVYDEINRLAVLLEKKQSSKVVRHESHSEFMCADCGKNPVLYDGDWCMACRGEGYEDEYREPPDPDPNERL